MVAGLQYPVDNGVERLGAVLRKDNAFGTRRSEKPSGIFAAAVHDLGGFKRHFMTASAGIRAVAAHDAQDRPGNCLRLGKGGCAVVKIDHRASPA